MFQLTNGSPNIVCTFICLVFVVNLFVVFVSVAKNGDALANAAALVHRKLQIKIQIVKLGWAATTATAATTAAHIHAHSQNPKAMWYVRLCACCTWPPNRNQTKRRIGPKCASLNILSRLVDLIPDLRYHDSLAFLSIRPFSIRFNLFEPCFYSLPFIVVRRLFRIFIWPHDALHTIYTCATY